MSSEVLIPDITGVVLSFLDIKTLCTASLVSKMWNSLAWKLGSFKDVVELTVKEDFKVPSYFHRFINLENFYVRTRLLNEESVMKDLDKAFGKGDFKKMKVFHCSGTKTVPKNIDLLTSLKNIRLNHYQGNFLDFDIGKLVNLEEFMIYGSKLTSIPSSIGNCVKLKKFCPYTSYSLHYLPYEIKNCTLINDFTISRRAVWGCRSSSPKPPEDLSSIKTEIRERCSVCTKKFGEQRIRKLTDTRIGFDKVALLCVVCSEKCLGELSDLTFINDGW